MLANFHPSPFPPPEVGLFQLPNFKNSKFAGILIQIMIVKGLSISNSNRLFCQCQHY